MTQSANDAEQKWRSSLRNFMMGVIVLSSAELLSLGGPSPCSYTGTGMSIADKLRQEQGERLKRLDTTARVELAFALGRRDIALYAAAHATTADEARRRLRLQRKTGRAPSSSTDE